MNKHYLSIILCSLNISFVISQWTSINPMNQIRASHVSAVLTDGTILVAGGFGETTQTKSAEYLEPSSGIWYATATEMSEFHSSGTATFLPNTTSDQVLIVGGWTGSVNTSSCEIYDKMANSWTNVAPMTIGRADHSATLLPNGKVLVVGGFDGINNLSSCELYNPTTDSWSAVAPLNIGRSSHTATLLNDGRVLITGGYNPNNGFQLISTEIYTPSTDTWVNGPDMAFARNKHAASILANGKVFVTGGEEFTGAMPYAYMGIMSAEVFDPSNNTFAPVQSLPSALCYHGQISFGDKVMLIAGKEQTDYSNSTFTSTPGKTYLYNVSSDSWEEKAMNLEGRIYFTAHLTMDNKVIVIGGQTDEVEVYDLTADLNESVDYNYSLAPNPASSILTLNINKVTKDCQFQIKDVSGRSAQSAVKQIGNSFQFDISTLKSGVYFLEVLENSDKSTIRFVKE